MAAAKTDVLIVGGGLLGLSTAMHLRQLRPQLSISLIEKDLTVASQQSGHNSGVLHAGIYYAPGSLKARFCVEGNRTLSEFCDKYGIPIVRCGKVIVASTELEAGRLERLFERGTANGVPDLRLVSRPELREIEPHVDGSKAIYAPHSAIVDFKKISERFAENFENAGGRIHFGTAFVSATSSGGERSRVVTNTGEFHTKLIINCAGLHSDIVAREMGCKLTVRIIPFRGEFYRLREGRRSLVNGLIYPVPDPALPFLGVHFTPRISGVVDAGPNAILATKREGYRRRDFSLREFASTLSYPGFWMLAARNLKPGLSEINRSLRKHAFVKSLQRLIPEIQADDLEPGESGVRAQAIDRQGKLIDDFRIESGPGAIHVLNAPSPAATSSLMIGKYIANEADLRINTD
jgi:(S)-2-hydroxyglutarate dehydrogenase